MKIDYLFGEAASFIEGDKILPNMTVKKVLSCRNCLRSERFLDSIYCAEKRYWIEENLNLVIPHCWLFEIAETELNYLDCYEDECESCKKECVLNENP